MQRFLVISLMCNDGDKEMLLRMKIARMMHVLSSETSASSVLDMSV